LAYTIRRCGSTMYMGRSLLSSNLASESAIDGGRAMSESEIRVVPLQRERWIGGSQGGGY